MKQRTIKSMLSKSFFTPILYKYWRIPAFDFYSRLIDNDALSKIDLEEIQKEKITKIMRYAFVNTPYYRNALNEKQISMKDLKDPNAIEAFPILTKKIIQENFNELINPLVDLNNFTLARSGGSTGEPTKVRRDLTAMAYTHAATWRANQWMGWRIGEPWMWLWGRLSTTKSSWKSKVLNIYKTVATQEAFFNVHRLDKNKIHAFVRAMRWFRPKVIEGYTNAFYQLCLLLKDENLRMPPLLGIATTAETLYPEQRKLIEDVLGCRIFNRYASSEVGLIASECSAHEGLHIAMENVYLECIREDGVPAAPGQIGKILITDLNNLSMPLIRYDLSDVGIVSPDPCSCGRPYTCLEKVIGRESDVLKLPGNKIVFPDDLAEIFYPINEVKQFQVIQDAPSKVSVYLVLERRKDFDRLKPGILKFLKEALGKETDIELRCVDNIPILPSGKHRICISKM